MRQLTGFALFSSSTFPSEPWCIRSQRVWRRRRRRFASHTHETSVHEYEWTRRTTLGNWMDYCILNANLLYKQECGSAALACCVKNSHSNFKPIKHTLSCRVLCIINSAMVIYITNIPHVVMFNEGKHSTKWRHPPREDACVIEDAHYRRRLRLAGLLAFTFF